MTKNQRIFILIVVIGIMIIISTASLFLLSRNNLSSDDTFVQEHLTYLDDGASDIDFLEVTLYFNENNAYLEIIYDYSYLGIERRTRYLVNRQSGQIVNGGYEDDFPEFMDAFNLIKINYTHKKVYSVEDIEQLLND
ncbi:MAG: hypothetical protein RBQ71_00215 [Acholeplasmataceae bacterium]|jgi:uncharacterized protein YxeA|nr:hypothetical protein [Acholeplasmataceae bacterium]